MESFLLFSGIALLVCGILIFMLGFSNVYKDSDDTRMYKIVSLVMVLCGFAIIW